MDKADDLWKDYLNVEKYQITNQHGKFGLKFKDHVLLEPEYSDLTIYNSDVPLSSPRIRKYIVYGYYFFEEWNFPIVQADGKCGLVNGERKKFELELRYDRIFKLSYDHYLCLEDDTYKLYKFFSGPPKITSVFHNSKEINLPELLDILNAEHPEAYNQLCENLPRKDNHYISNFWRYQGGEFYPEISHWQYLTIAARKGILSANFEVTPLELVWVGSV